MAGRSSFLQGTAILVAGNLLSRSLGAVYRIVLPILMGGGQRAAVGIGLFMMAYPVYTVILGIAGTGLPLAVSKLVSEHVARGDGRTAAAVMRTAFITLAVVGVVFTALLLVFAQPLADAVYRDPRAALSIDAIAPAVFFVALMSAYRGFFQGIQHMAPHAASQVVEQVFRIGTMFVLAVVLLPLGIQYAAAGASFGAVTGAVAGLVFIAWVFRREGTAALPEGGPASAVGGRVLLLRLLNLAVPISLAAMVLPIMNVIDAAVVPLRLHAAGLGAESTALYGVLTGFALPFVVAPSAITAMLQVSLVPAVSEAMTAGGRVAARARAAAGVRAGMLISLPAAVGIFLVARPITQLFYHTAAAARPLEYMAGTVIFLGLQQVTSGILQGLGLPGLPLRNLAVGAAVKLAVSWPLVAMPAMNISGAALGTTLGFLVASVLNVISMQRRLGGVLDWDAAVLRPAAAVLVMAVAVRGILTTVHRGLALPTVAAVVIGAGVYATALLLMGGVRRRDLERVPGVGPRLAVALCRLHVLRT